MPCQVPSASTPSVTGTCSDTPVSMVFTCAGMSSGPSTSCTHPASAGATRPSAVVRSVRTSGSAFSWITSDADVCRMKTTSKPASARASVTKRCASRVISMKPCPCVATESLAVAISSGVTLVAADNRTLTKRSATAASVLVEHVFLQRHDHLGQAPPDLLHETHHLVEVGIVRQLQARLFRLRCRLIRLHRAGQRQIVRDQLLLERDVLALQPRDLGLQRRALVGHRLAGPSDRPSAADRDLAGAPVETQIAIVGTVEGVAVVLVLRRTALREGRQRREHQSGNDDQGRADHG